MAHQRTALERLGRYIARGALAKERIELGSDGKVFLKLKNAYNDGTTNIKLTAEQFIKRLIALIPPLESNSITGAISRERRLVFILE